MGNSFAPRRAWGAWAATSASEWATPSGRHRVGDAGGTTVYKLLPGASTLHRAQEQKKRGWGARRSAHRNIHQVPPGGDDSRADGTLSPTGTAGEASRPSPRVSPFAPPARRGCRTRGVGRELREEEGERTKREKRRREKGRPQEAARPRFGRRGQGARGETGTRPAARGRPLPGRLKPARRRGRRRDLPPYPRRALRGQSPDRDPAGDTDGPGAAGTGAVRPGERRRRDSGTWSP